jgi:hypothetical protein
MAGLIYQIQGIKRRIENGDASIFKINALFLKTETSPFFKNGYTGSDGF